MPESASPPAEAKAIVPKFAIPGRAVYSLVLALIFISSLAANLYPVLHSPEKIRSGFGIFGDSFLYHRIAVNLYNGHGFSGVDDGRPFARPLKDNIVYEPATLRGPVYPYFLCAVYKIFGDREAMDSVDTWGVNWDCVRIVQCVLSALTSLLVFALVRLIWPGGFWWSMVAGLLHAFCFYNIFYARALLSESLSTFLLTAGVFLSVLALKKGKPWVWIAAGALFGLVILSRGEYLPFLLLFGVYILWVHRGQGLSGIRCAGLFIGAACLTILPWTIRNYVAFRQFIPVSVGGLGSSLYIGTFETETSQKGWRGFSSEVFYFPGEQEKFTALQTQFDDYCLLGSIRVQEVDKELQQMALKRIAARPLECVSKWFIKIPRLWYQNYIQMYIQREASGNWFVFYFLFALVGFCLAAKDEKMLMGLIALLFLYLNLIFLPLHVEPRYAVALIPAIIVLTGVGLGKMWTRISNRRVATPAS